MHKKVLSGGPIFSIWKIGMSKIVRLSDHTDRVSRADFKVADSSRFLQRWSVSTIITETRWLLFFLFSSFPRIDYGLLVGRLRGLWSRRVLHGYPLRRLHLRKHLFSVRVFRPISGSGTVWSEVRLSTLYLSLSLLIFSYSSCTSRFDTIESTIVFIYLFFTSSNPIYKYTYLR